MHTYNIIYIILQKFHIFHLDEKLTSETKTCEKLELHSIRREIYHEIINIIIYIFLNEMKVLFISF